MAYDQIRTYGMNKRIGHLSFLENQNMTGYKPYSKQLASIIDEVSKIMSIHTQNLSNRIYAKNQFPIVNEYKLISIRSLKLSRRASSVFRWMIT